MVLFTSSCMVLWTSFHSCSGTLCLPDLIPWICSSPPLYNNKGFDYVSCEWPSGFYSEKAMALHSSTLAWRIPWKEEPGRLQSMGLLRVGHSWATSLSLFTFMHWRRKWQPTPLLLPGESQGRQSLVGCRLWGHRVGHNWSDLAAAAAAPVAFPTFFNISLNLAIRRLYSEPQSVPSLVFADYLELLYLWLQGYNQSYFGIDHLVMSMCRVLSVLLEEGVRFDKCILLAKLLLAFALLHSVLQGQTYYSRYLLTSYFCIPVP